MNNSRIYFSGPNLSEQDIHAVADTLRRGWVASVGPELSEFESRLKQKFGYSNVALLNSGTSALHMAVKLAGVHPGDKVLIGAFTFIAVFNAVKYEGGVPIFIDSESDTWNIDPSLLEMHLSKTFDTPDHPKAVIITHIFGRPAKMQELISICEKYNVKLIEDAAEALGSMYNGCNVGGLADYGIISFNGNKIITTGGGGALICKHKDDDLKVRYWSDQSKIPAGHYNHGDVGYNYKLSNVLAGLGLSQLNKFDDHLKSKQRIHDLYQEQLSDIDWLELPYEPDRSNHWVNSFLIADFFKDKITPELIVNALEAENIESRRFWKPLHMQPVCAGCDFLGEMVSEDLFDRGICLPSGSGLTDVELNRVVESLKKIKVN